MSKKLALPALCVGIFLLSGCTDNTHKTNELYSANKKIPHTLYPKKVSTAKQDNIEIPLNQNITSKVLIKEHKNISVSKNTTKNEKMKKKLSLHPLILDKNKRVISKKTSKKNENFTQKQNTLSVTIQPIPTPVKPVKVISHEQIAKILACVNVVKTNASKEILDSIKVIKALKPISQKDLPKPPSAVVDIARAKAVAKIAKSVAFVESAKAVAKANIAKAVADVQLAQFQDQNHSITQKDVKNAQLKSAQDVAKAVATTQIAKAKAAATIAKSVAKVENKKATISSKE